MSAPLPVVAGGYQVTVHGSNNGLPNGMVFGYELSAHPATGTADVAAAQALGDAVANAWETWASDVYVDDYAAPSVTVYPLNTPLSPATVSISTAVGGQTGPPVNMATAALISHSVFRRGRGSQSRNYVSHFKQAWVDADGESLTGANRSTIQAAWNTFLSDVATGVASATGLVATFSQISRTTTAHLHTIIGSNVEIELATQRSRTTR